MSENTSEYGHCQADLIYQFDKWYNVAIRVECKILLVANHIERWSVGCACLVGLLCQECSIPSKLCHLHRHAHHLKVKKLTFTHGSHSPECV